LVLDSKECRLAPHLELITRPFRMQALKKRITIRTLFNENLLISQEDIHVDDIYTIIDENKIAQVLRNFLSNAIKFTPEGGTIQIMLEPSYEGRPRSDSRLSSFRISKASSFGMSSKVSTIQPDFIRVVVTDSGHGISLENQQRLFKEAVQFHAGEQQGGGGSGFGLWFSKQIIDLHGGRVGIFSEGEGRGSSFYFELPVSKVDTRHSIRMPLDYQDQSQLSIFDPYDSEIPSKSTISRHIPAEEPSIDIGIPHQVSWNLMLVDDSTLNRKCTGRLVGSLGHTFDEASDGDECIELIRSSLLPEARHYDAVLIDNHMPNVSGPTAVKALREMGYHGLVVGVTGDISEEDVGVFKRSGADEVLVKPIHHADIVRLLSTITQH
jgi:CheY-like chemotaxis protein